METLGEIGLMTTRIIKHEAVPQTGSFEVRFPDGRPSVYIYWDDVASRRLGADQMDSKRALAAAKTLARSERDNEKSTLSDTEQKNFLTAPRAYGANLNLACSAPRFAVGLSERLEGQRCNHQSKLPPRKGHGLKTKSAACACWLAQKSALLVSQDSSGVRERR